MLFSFLGFIFIAYLGFYYTGKVKKEKEELSALIRFNKNLILNLQYKKQNLIEFINSYQDEDILEILKNFKKNIKTGKKFQLNFKDVNLKREVENYFKNLGKSDSISQLEFVQSYQVIFENKYTEFCENANKKISLYPKLGLLFGGILFIVLL